MSEKSKVSHRNHCRSDPVRVQSTFSNYRRVWDASCWVKPPCVCNGLAVHEKLQASRLLGEFAQLHSDRVTAAPRHATDSVSIPQTHTASRWSSHCRRPGIGPPDRSLKETCHACSFRYISCLHNCLSVLHSALPLPACFCVVPHTRPASHSCVLSVHLIPVSVGVHPAVNPVFFLCP